MADNAVAKPAAKSAPSNFEVAKAAACRVTRFREVKTKTGDVVPVIRIVTEANGEAQFCDIWLNGIESSAAEQRLSPGTTFNADLAISKEGDVAKDADGNTIHTAEGTEVVTYRAYMASKATDLKSALTARSAFGF